jgi:hypothetical protein
VNIMAELLTVNVAYFQRNIQLSRFLAYADFFVFPINSEKWTSIVLQNHSFTVLFRVIWYIKY